MIINRRITKAYKTRNMKLIALTAFVALANLNSVHAEENLRGKINYDPAAAVEDEAPALQGNQQVLTFGNATASDALLLNEELERTSVAQSCVKRYVNDYLRKSANGRKTVYRHRSFDLRGEKWEGDCSSFVYRVIEEGCGDLIHKIWEDQFYSRATCREGEQVSEEKLKKGWFWRGTHCAERVRADGFRKAIGKAHQITHHDRPVPRNQMYRFENAKKLKAYDLIGYSIKESQSCRTPTGSGTGDTGHVMFVKKIEEATSSNPKYGRLRVLVVDSSKTGHGNDRRRGSSTYSGVGEGYIDIFYRKTSGKKVYVMGLAGDNANKNPETALTKNLRCHNYFMARFGGAGGTASGLEMEWEGDSGAPSKSLLGGVSGIADS